MSNIGIQFKDENNNNVYPNPFPVGSIYMSVNSTNPSRYFGGTWTQIKDRFLLCAGDTYSGGSTGGEATHRLTVSELPPHYHSFMTGRWYWAESAGGGEIINSQSETSYSFMRNTESTGGNQPHNNMPPYLVVYVWKRIS